MDSLVVVGQFLGLTPTSISYDTSRERHSTVATVARVFSAAVTIVAHHWHCFPFCQIFLRVPGRTPVNSLVCLIFSITALCLLLRTLLVQCGLLSVR